MVKFSVFQQIFRWPLIRMVRSYQVFISPVLPNQCRFEPSCSEYAIEALKKRGILKGLFLIGGRILRCHPFCKGGYDPVPLSQTSRGISKGACNRG